MAVARVKSLQLDIVVVKLLNITHLFCKLPDLLSYFSLPFRFSVAFDKIKAFVTESVPLYEDLFSELDVRWAWSTVNTRSVYLETASHPLLLLDPEESNVALAPFLDLLNHSDSAQVEVHVPICFKFVVWLKRGTEIAVLE